LSNVLKKMYDGTVIRVDDTTIFVGGGKGEGVGQLPLEIMARGEYEPRYRTELDVNSGEIPLLPLSVDGALAMARAGDGMSSTSEWFIYKYNRATSGLAGVSFDDGRFAVYGYCSGETSGGGLRSLSDGDRIDRIRVLAGADKLLNDGQDAIADELP
jgi:cyclophilin family peptidyl-prolyl cis-trans isomerase